MKPVSPVRFGAAELKGFAYSVPSASPKDPEEIAHLNLREDLMDFFRGASNPRMAELMTSPAAENLVVELKERPGSQHQGKGADLFTITARNTKDGTAPVTLSRFTVADAFPWVNIGNAGRQSKMDAIKKSILLRLLLLLDRDSFNK